MKRTYVIDGGRFSTLEEFYDEISHVLIPECGWGENLNAFNDILRGGFGTPDEGFVLRWENSEISRQKLGYPETARQLRSSLETCHSTNRDRVEADIRDAEMEVGPTVFDWLVEIIQTHCNNGAESEDGVELELA